MTMQEAYALAMERDANLSYRKKIQRIKNTILSAIGGGFTGLLVGGMATDKSPLDYMLNKPMPKGKILGGAALGATLGGLTGYGLTRLKEKYNESAGMDPTLAGLKVYPGLKAASANSLEKSAQFAELGRIIGQGGAQLGRGISWLSSNAGKLAGKAGRASLKKLNRLLELIGGGKEETLKDYKLVKDFAKEQVERAKATGGDVKAMEEQLANVKDSFLNGTGGAFDIPAAGGHTIRVTPTKEISDELGKVIAARTLAGGGAIGGGYYIMKKRNEKNKPWFKKLFD